MTDITERIAEGRRLEQALPAAPWDAVSGTIGGPVSEVDPESVDFMFYVGSLAPGIARMRNEYAALLDVVEAAQAYRDRVGPVFADESTTHIDAALARFRNVGGAS